MLSSRLSHLTISFTSSYYEPCKILLCFVSPTTLPGIRDDVGWGCPAVSYVASSDGVHPGGIEELRLCHKDSRGSPKSSRDLQDICLMLQSERWQCMAAAQATCLTKDSLGSLQHNLCRVEGRVGCHHTAPTQQAARRQDEASGTYPETSMHQPTAASRLSQLSCSRVQHDLNLLTKAADGWVTPRSHWCCGPKVVKQTVLSWKKENIFFLLCMTLQVQQ